MTAQFGEISRLAVLGGGTGLMPPPPPADSVPVSPSLPVSGPP
ncbi:hypothetical protein [Actinoplanes siamensis]|nr:hypothetical protein [Actinoplanes siamensis]